MGERVLAPLGGEADGGAVVDVFDELCVEEDAAVVCYGISAAYKESVNCRMEAQYAFQQQTDMVPLMLEEGYSPKGWLGMLLGVRLLKNQDYLKLRMEAQDQK